MTSQEKTLIKQMRLNGQSYRSIAEELNIPIGSIKSFISRLAKKGEPTFCLCCGRRLKQTKGHRQKKFCSAECKGKWWYKHQELHADKGTYHTHICVNCGKEFTTFNHPERKYCSRECYLKSRGVKSNAENKRIP